MSAPDIGDDAGRAYDRYCAPVFIEPFAPVLAAVFAGQVGRLIETACGSGIATAAVMRAGGPGLCIVATDADSAVLDLVRERCAAESVVAQYADAHALPFGSDSFDGGFCQFGVMFFADRPSVYREMARVLRPAAQFAFLVWDRIDANPLHAAGDGMRAAIVPATRPAFARDVLCGYHDRTLIGRELDDAGFCEISIEAVCRKLDGDPRALARAAILGSPSSRGLAADLHARLAAAEHYYRRHVVEGSCTATALLIRARKRAAAGQGVTASS